MRKLFTIKEENFIYDSYMDLTYEEIAKKLGHVTGKQVRTWASQHGLRKNRKINDTYFNIIDTPIKAYFLGFIYADGWVCHSDDFRHCEFGMELQSEDKYVLEKLNEELGNQNIIYHHDPYVHMIGDNVAHTGHRDCLRVYSKPLVKSLIRNGIETNKTQKDIYPIVSNELFFDWLRGYIDGDGCFYSNSNKHIYMHITCSSNIPLIYIQDKLFKYGIKTTIYKEKERKYRLACTNFNSMKILVNHLYYKDDLFYLNRKYEKVKHLLGLAA